jgi:hypothetical protein
MSLNKLNITLTWNELLKLAGGALNWGLFLKDEAEVLRLPPPYAGMLCMNLLSFACRLAGA